MSTPERPSGLPINTNREFDPADLADRHAAGMRRVDALDHRIMHDSSFCEAIVSDLFDPAYKAACPNDRELATAKALAITVSGQPGSRIKALSDDVDSDVFHLFLATHAMTVPPDAGREKLDTAVNAYKAVQTALQPPFNRTVTDSLKESITTNKHITDQERDHMTRSLSRKERPEANKFEKLLSEKGLGTMSEYDRLVGRVVGRYYSHPEYEDVRQIAQYSLLESIQKYDPSSEVPFEALAFVEMRRQIRLHFRKTSSRFYIPGKAIQTYLRMGIVDAELSQTLQRHPTQEELAEAMDVSPDQLSTARVAQTTEKPAYFDGGSDYIDAGPKDEDPFEHATDLAVVNRVLPYLSRRERKIIELTLQNKDQYDIARLVGVSQPHVNRILKSSIKTLIELIGGQEVD